VKITNNQMKILYFNDPHLMKQALVSYKKILGDDKPKILKPFKYFPDKKVTKGHFLDITI